MNVQDRADPSCPQPRAKTALALAATALAASLLFGSAAARASESVLPVTPPGSTDIDQAILPPGDGLYMGLFALPYSANQDYFDASGHKAPAARSIHDNTHIGGPAFLYVYPFHPFGATLGTTFVQPFAVQDTAVGTLSTSTNSGAMDAFSDILFWSQYVGLAGATKGELRIRYGLTLGAAFSLIVPDGNYDKHHILKLSGHSWVLDPNISITYNTGPHLSFGDNTQISTRLFYAIPQQDFTTHYQSGNIINLDWSVTQQFGRFRAGVAGYYQAQVNNDRRADGTVPPGGNKYVEAAVGPVFEYFFSNGMFLKAKYSWTVYHKNYVDQQFLSISTGFKF